MLPPIQKCCVRNVMLSGRSLLNSATEKGTLTLRYLSALQHVFETIFFQHFAVLFSVVQEWSSACSEDQ